MGRRRQSQADQGKQKCPAQKPARKTFAAVVGSQKVGIVERRNRACDQIRSAHGHAGAYRQWREQILADARHEGQGKEDHHRGDGGNEHGKGNFLRAVQHRLPRQFAHVEMPHGVLDVHDAIVDYPPEDQRSPPRVMMFKVWPVK